MARSNSTRPGSPMPEWRGARLPLLLLTCLLAGTPDIVQAAGTAAGTVIENTAQVDFDVDGTRVSINSNTVTVLVAERVDVTVVALTPQVSVSAGDTGRGTLFLVTNTGNGTEPFALDINNLLTGDDFDPVAATPSIYFDTDGSGDLTPGDEVYVPGTNDPDLAADASVSVLLVNDILAGLANGSRGLTELSARSMTGNDAPGTVVAGGGDGGVDALIGASGGLAAAGAEYVVVGVNVGATKSVTIADPFGGTTVVPGAVLTYSIDVAVADAGTAFNSALVDAIPDNTTYIPASLRLNGVPLSDAIDADAGEFNDSAAPNVAVRLGDLTQADGVQTVTFQVSVD